MVDQITQARMMVLETERDDAVEHAAEVELDNLELRETNSVLIAQIIKIREDANYPVSLG